MAHTHKNPDTPQAISGYEAPALARDIVFMVSGKLPHSRGLQT